MAAARRFWIRTVWKSTYGSTPKTGLTDATFRTAAKPLRLCTGWKHTSVSTTERLSTARSRDASSFSPPSVICENINEFIQERNPTGILHRLGCNSDGIGIELNWIELNWIELNWIEFAGVRWRAAINHFEIVIIWSRTCYHTPVNVLMRAATRRAAGPSPNAIRGNRIWPNTKDPMEMANASRPMKPSDAKCSIPSIPMRFVWPQFLPSTECKVLCIAFHFISISNRLTQFAFPLPAYAVIPLSAESVNRMTQRSGLSLQQLLKDRNLALQPADGNEAMETSYNYEQSSNHEESSDASLQDPLFSGNPFVDFSHLSFEDSLIENDCI